jgi:hypothetical protein
LQCPFPVAAPLTDHPQVETIIESEGRATSILAKNSPEKLARALQSQTLMKLTTLLIVFFSFTAYSQPCDEENASTDLEKALSVAPTVKGDEPLSVDLADNKFEASGLRSEVFARAKKAFEIAWSQGKTRKTVYTIIDYGMNSKHRRLWIVDMETGQLLYNEYVSHGVNSGVASVSKMSNESGSKTSNIGLLKTAETYYGKHGLSLKLDGLEPGFNDNARDRYIVMHAANYATHAFVQSQGRLGRSYGCPALAPTVSKEIIEKIKGGSLLFGDYPDEKWLKSSSYLSEK